MRQALLGALPDHELVGLDTDDAAVAESTERLGAFGDRARVVKARFDELPVVVRTWAPGRPVAGVLFDLGVSSPQLDRPERGFSYRFDGPLDMRMDRSRGATAADLVNGLSVAELTRLFADNGEGRFARRLAEGIVANRPIETTSRLVQVIDRSLPGVARKRAGHPAKRVFQALRIEVNEELEVLAAGLESRARHAEPWGPLRRPVVPLGRGPARQAMLHARRERRMRLSRGPAVRMRRGGDRPRPHARRSHAERRRDGT